MTTTIPILPTVKKESDFRARDLPLWRHGWKVFDRNVQAIALRRMIPQAHQGTYLGHDKLPISNPLMNLTRFFKSLIHQCAARDCLYPSALPCRTTRIQLIDICLGGQNMSFYGQGEALDPMTRGIASVLPPDPRTIICVKSFIVNHAARLEKTDTTQSTR